MAQTNKNKKSLFDSPLLKSKIKSANAKIFPEGAIGYFIGPTLALLANSILASYLNTYLSNVLNINAWAKWFFTWLPVISVVFVIVGNILVGRLMDRNKSKAGKARPLLLMSVPISVIALLILFVFPPFVNGEGGIGSNEIISLILIAIGYNLWFAIAYPFYYTPHAALVGLSTRSSKDRSLLATISNATMLAAIGLTNMILPFFLGKLFVVQTDVAKLPAGAIPVLEDGVITKYTLNGAVVYDQVASYEHWKIFVIALMAITVVGALVEFFFTRERVTEETAGVSKEIKQTISLKQQAKVCFKDKFWLIMILFFFLYQLGGMMKNVSQIYFCQAMFDDAGQYSIEIGGRFHGLLSIIGAVPTALGMVLAWPISNKIGKGKAIMLGAVVSVIGGVIGLIAPTNFTVVVISFVVKALGSTPAMYLSLALLADITDHQEALHGFRTDGLTMTIYGAIMAGMTGIATGILNGVLGAVGYTDTNIASATIQGVMPWIFIGGETICYAIIFVTFLFMKVEKFSKFDHKAIVIDQKAAAEAEGREYIDPQTKMQLEEQEAELASQQAHRDEIVASCKKKGVDPAEELKAYEEKLEAAKKADEQKKAAAEQKKEEAKKAEEARIAALTGVQKTQYEQKLAHARLKEQSICKEFNALRVKAGKTEIPAEE